MKYTDIQIFDHRIRAYTSAELIEDPGDHYVETADALWSIYKKRFLTQHYPYGRSNPEHGHWNWKLKLEQERLEHSFYKCFAIVCEEPQGLMMLKYGSNFVGRYAGQIGQPLVYLAYLESAPWNLKEYCDKIRYSEVGKEFYRTAIRFSHLLGFAEQVGLHALPSSEGFYAKTCQMVSLGHDPDCDNLTYFESVQDNLGERTMTNVDIFSNEWGRAATEDEAELGGIRIGPLRSLGTTQNAEIEPNDEDEEALRLEEEYLRQKLADQLREMKERDANGREYLRQHGIVTPEIEIPSPLNVNFASR